MKEAPPTYSEPLVAFVRARLPGTPIPDADSAWEVGRAHGLRLHKFKRTTTLPRVKHVLGVLRGLGPDSLLDIGSGRGTFVWPLLDAMPWLRVTTLELSDRRHSDFEAVRAGGVERLTAWHGSVLDIPADESSFDVVSALEVLEHLREPRRAVAELVRVGRRFLVASVPSKPDENPEHIQYFSAPEFAGLFEVPGVARVRVEHVLNHRVAVVRLAQ